LIAGWDGTVPQCSMQLGDKRRREQKELIAAKQELGIQKRRDVKSKPREEGLDVAKRTLVVYWKLKLNQKCPIIA